MATSMNESGKEKLIQAYKDYKMSQELKERARKILYNYSDSIMKISYFEGYFEDLKRLLIEREVALMYLQLSEEYKKAALKPIWNRDVQSIIRHP